MMIYMGPTADPNLEIEKHRHHQNERVPPGQAMLPVGTTEYIQTNIAGLSDEQNRIIAAIMH